MPNWKEKLDVRLEMTNARMGKMTVQQAAASVANKLKQSRAYLSGDIDLKVLVDEMENVAQDPMAGPVDFDFVWDSVYDWADEGHRMWIVIK